MTVELKHYAELRGVTCQFALEEAREADALVFRGSKILVDVEKINKYLDEEIQETLTNVKGLEV